MKTLHQKLDKNIYKNHGLTVTLNFYEEMLLSEVGLYGDCKGSYVDFQITVMS